MYEVSSVIANVEAHLVLAMVVTAIVWGAGLLQISEAVRLGRRDRIPAVPAATTVFLFAHDFTYVLHFITWFHVVDHWYFTMFWFGMLGAVGIEVVLIIQFLSYGHQRIAPKLSRTAFVGCYLILQVATLLMLWWVQSVLDDPLNLITMTATSIFQVLPLVPWIISRGNASGQSMTFAVAGLLGPGSIGMFLLVLMEPSFGTPVYYGIIAVQVIASVAYIALLRYYRRAAPARDTQHDDSSVAASTA
jgi:hypothetical protein